MKKGVKIESEEVEEVEEVEESSEDEVHEVIMVASSSLRRTLETRASKRRRAVKA